MFLMKITTLLVGLLSCSVVFGSPNFPGSFAVVLKNKVDPVVSLNITADSDKQALYLGLGSGLLVKS